MTTLQQWGAAPADVWGLVLLIALVGSLLIALVCWAAEALRWRRVRKTRRRFSAEAIREAQAVLGRGRVS